jgi:hypothetical protein
MSYPGRDRRRRFVYVTRNTEYHCHDGVCVAVRDRNSGDWAETHTAMRRRLEGGVRVFPSGVAVPMCDDPEVGSPIYFAERNDGDTQVITSRVEAVDRPAIEDLARYPKTG